MKQKAKCAPSKKYTKVKEWVVEWTKIKVVSLHKGMRNMIRWTAAQITRVISN